MPGMENTLYYGDNLAVMRQHLAADTVDLVYLDPPFNSHAAYNVLFAEKNGSRSEAQLHAFKDSWAWDHVAAECYQDAVEAGGTVADAMISFRKLLGETPMMAYLAMMAPRLVELRRVLKPTGSLYLHCDPTASHYLKLLLDSIFGVGLFRTEIIWERVTSAASSKAIANSFPRNHDVILMYTKGKDSTFNRIYQPYSEKYIGRFTHEDGRGKYYWDHLKTYSQETLERLIEEDRVKLPLTPGRNPRVKNYLHEGKGQLLSNVWSDIPPINSQAQERLGYPTQKPEALLERIIKASSNEGDLVLDPFCGCGTTVSVAQRLGRAWIGIDITFAAMTLMKERLVRAFGDQVKYKTVGEPTSLPDARALAESDPYQFQWWALGLVGARPADEKKGADHGIDGRLFFHDEPTGGETKEIVLSVKAGHTNVAHVRDLGHVVDREGAVIGVLITMQEPTRPMRAEAAGTGFYVHPVTGQRYPKLQIVTVEELLAGKLIERPYASFPTATFKPAPAAKKAHAEPPALPLDED